MFLPEGSWSRLRSRASRGTAAQTQGRSGAIDGVPAAPRILAVIDRPAATAIEHGAGGSPLRHDRVRTGLLAADPSPQMLDVYAVRHDIFSPAALTRISHTFGDAEAIRGEKVSRYKSLTAAGQADPFRQSVFQPSADRLMDIG